MKNQSGPSKPRHTTTKSRWLHNLAPRNQSLLRLVCIPHAGGGRLTYRDWAQYIPAHIGLFAIELPGHGSRLAEAPWTNLSNVAEAIAEVIRPGMHTPSALFGHSLGALIAFEVTKRLMTTGNHPDVVIVSGHAAPHLCQDRSEVEPSDAFLMERIRELGGTPEPLLADREFRNMVLLTLRADWAMGACHTRLPRSAVQCPLVALAGSADPSITPADILAWRDCTTQAFKFHLVKGGHFFHQLNASAVIRIVLEEVATVVSWESTC